MLGAALCVCPSRSSLTSRPTALQFVPASYLFAPDGVLKVVLWKRCGKTGRCFARLRVSLEVRKHLAIPAEEFGEVGDGCIAFVAS
jgi:hypothetical protein